MENFEAEAIRLIKLKLKEKGWNSSVLAAKMAGLLDETRQLNAILTTIAKRSKDSL